MIRRKKTLHKVCHLNKFAECQRTDCFQFYTLKHKHTPNVQMSETTKNLEIKKVLWITNKSINSYALKIKLRILDFCEKCYLNYI